MRRKIIRSVFAFFFLSFVLMFFCFYFYSKNENLKTAKTEIQNELSSFVFMVEETDLDSTLQFFEKNYKNTRITIIQLDGSIVYDSLSLTTENHLDRPEIINCGKIYERYSDTLHQRMLYLAIQQDTQYVRIAIPYKIIDKSNVNFVIYAVIIECIICILFAIYLSLFTKKAFKPLQEQTLKLSKLAGNTDNIYYVDDVDVLSSQIKLIQNILEDQMNSLKTEQEKLSDVLALVDYGICVIGLDEKCIIINSYVKNIFSSNMQNGMEYIYYIQNQKAIQEIQKCLNNFCKGQIQFQEKNHYYQMNIDLINGKWISTENGLLITFYDITELYKSDLMKKEFFASASHELKSPLTTIIGYCQMIQSGIYKDENEKIDMIQRIDREALRMNKIVKDMLDLSKMETEMSRNLTGVSVLDKINIILKSLEGKIQEKNLMVTKNIEQDILIYNEDDFEKLIYNLLENAIIYNKENGSITVEYHKESKTLIVKDTGVGIEETEIPHIFERFYRVDKSKSKLSGGTGLGLSIVKHILSYYQDKIYVESKLQEGTSFIIEFNQKKA